MISQPGKQTIAIHILPYISRSKHNQAMKFGQLIEYDMKNIFLKNSYAKLGGETSSRPFCKKSKLSIFLYQHSKVLQFIFIVCKAEGYQNILKLNCRPLDFTSYKVFLKNQKQVGN